MKDFSYWIKIDQGYLQANSRKAYLRKKQG